jgi:putative chitinase
LIQLTGRSNYEAIGRILGIDLISNPELVNDPKYAAPVAMAYLTSKAGSSSSDRNDFFIGDLTRNKLKRIVGHDNTIKDGETLTPAQIRWNRTEQLEDEMYP